MKKFYTILVAVLITANSFAQTPEKMSYQAVVRDSGDNLITNQTIGMQISILQTTETGTAVYVETQTPTSNVNGLVSLEIGTGSVVSGNFTAIDWSADTYFIKTETDPTGGSSYTITGTSQLMSVPYALYAKTSGSSTPGPTGAQGPAGNDGADGVGIAQTLSFTSPNITLSDNGGTVDLTELINDADSDISNEIQNLYEVLTEGNTAGNQIKNVTDPTDTQDATTKAYVDNLILQVGSVAKLLGAGFTVEQLLTAGHTVTDILDAGVTLEELVDAGASVTDLIAAGQGEQNIIDAGADLVEFMDSTGATPWILHFTYGVSIVSMLEDDITIADMTADGITLTDLQADDTLGNYRTAGATIIDLVNAGYTFGSLVVAGAYWPEIHSAGYTIQDLLDAGYSFWQLARPITPYYDYFGLLWVDFQEGGYTALDLFNGGVSVGTLVKIGATFTEMINDGISISAILQGTWGEHSWKHYFTVSDLLREGISEATLTVLGLTTQQTIDMNIQIRLNNGETPIQIYESDNSLLNDIYGKIYQGGYIVFLQTVANDYPNYGEGYVIAKEYHGQYPSCMTDPSPRTDLQIERGYRDGIGEGYRNTEQMASNCAPEINAATICLNLEYGGYDDWYLPDLSIMEYYDINYRANSTLFDIPNSMAYYNMLHSSPIRDGNKVYAMQNGFRFGLWQSHLHKRTEGFFFPTRDF